MRRSEHGRQRCSVCLPRPPTRRAGSLCIFHIFPLLSLQDGAPAPASERNRGKKASAPYGAPPAFPDSQGLREFGCGVTSRHQAQFKRSSRNRALLKLGRFTARFFGVNPTPANPRNKPEQPMDALGAPHQHAVFTSKWRHATTHKREGKEASICKLQA